MLHTIENEYLKVTVSEKGAELQSIQGRDGVEYLWQGDPAYWCDRALNLFPYVARLWQKSYTLDGTAYELPIHGFAPQSRFSLAGKTCARMVLELRDSEETLVQYPRRFAFRVIYTLDGSRLSVTFEAENLDRKAMYFGLGGHPGFNVPLEEGKSFEDYSLTFCESCSPVRVGFTPDCYVNGDDKPFLLEDGRTLRLKHNLFDEDAIVLSNMSRSVTLEAAGSSRSVTVSFPDMPYLGIWHMPRTDAPYVCIEPWVSLPGKHGEITALEEQKDLICLQPGAVYINTWTIEINA